MVLHLAEAGAASPGLPSWMFFGGIFAIVYFLLLRPQAKEQKKRREMLDALKKNDKVMTSSGMIGQIVALDEKEVTLKVDDNVRIRFVRSAIDRLIEPPAPSGE